MQKAEYFSKRQQMFNASRSTVRPKRLIDVNSETSPNLDADWRELSGYEEEDSKVPNHYTCIGLHSGFYCSSVRIRTPYLFRFLTQKSGFQINFSVSSYWRPST
jgi:hypothetical protein